MKDNDEKLLRNSIRLLRQSIIFEGRLDSGKTYTKMKACRRTEGRLFMLYRLLQAVNGYLGDGGPFRAFRLKDLNDWLVPSAFSSDLYNLLVGKCGTDCQFCYQKGNPPLLNQCSYIVSDKELGTRKKYFKNRRALFPINYYNSDEILSHPRIFEILEHLRRERDDSFEIYTNGCYLTEAVVKRLKALEPVLVYLSLNSSNPAVRRRIMRDQDPGVAIAAPKHLQRYGITTRVSIVLDPTVPSQDIIDTILYADDCDVNTIFIRLPNFTRYSPLKAPPDLEDTWRAMIIKINGIMPRVKPPIFFIPALLINYLFNVPPELPAINGVIYNSPAHGAGIRKNDVIEEINRIKINSRFQVINIIQRLPQGHDVHLKIKRGDETLEPVVKNQPWCRPGAYPYPYDSLMGLLVAADISDRSGYLIETIIQQYNARRVLFLSTRLMERRLRVIIQRCGLDSKYELSMLIPENHFFGGYTPMGGLWIIDDIITGIRKWVAGNGTVDLIIIPSTPFSPWGRDLVGESYLRISHETGLPVHILPTHLMHHY
jgi:hypothetical protein